MTTIDIQKNVNPHFKSVWQSNKPYNVLKGGRNWSPGFSQRNIPDSMNLFS